MLSYWCFHDVSTSHYMAMMVGLISNDLEKISKVAAVDYSRTQHSPGRNEKNMANIEQ